MKGYLRATCNVSSGEAARLRRLARVVDTVPNVGQHLHDGRLGTVQANELARARSNPRCGGDLHHVAPHLLQHAEFLSYDDFRTCVQRWESLADLDGTHRDRDRSVANRTATVVPFGHGIDISMSGGDGLVAEELIAIHEAVTELEFRRDLEARRRTHGDEASAHPLARTAHQRRFDAMVAIFRRAANCTDDTPISPNVDIQVDERTVHEAFARHGLLPEPTGGAPADPNRRRCETTRGAVIHPDDALRAMLLGHVRRVVIDSAGVRVAHGRRNRLFGGTLREVVKSAARRCTHPGCTIPATVAQVDHIAEWSERGGATEAENGDVRCGSHNRLKNNGYRTERDGQGRMITFRPDGTPMVAAGESIPLSANVDLRYRIVPWPTTGADPPADP